MKPDLARIHCAFYYNIGLDSGKIITPEDWFEPHYQQIVAESIEAVIADWSEEQRSILWDGFPLLI